eukprot:m.1487214 g.1487214  ORF g.1487214 m.1487214 type:complete len:72 (+) comp25185_c1_seq7:5432-5647(+)
MTCTSSLSRHGINAHCRVDAQDVVRSGNPCSEEDVSAPHTQAIQAMLIRTVCALESAMVTWTTHVQHVASA